MLIALLIVAAAAAGPDPSELPVYRCAAATQPIQIDGKLDDPAWATAAWTSDFVPLRRPTEPAPPRTRAKLLWDERHLYVAAELSEKDIRGEMKDHDSHVFLEGAFELFMDPDDDGENYLELQVNALNTTFDLLMSKPYSQRGKANESFEIDGLRTAVHINGTLNDSGDEDRSWTVEIAIPWPAPKEIAPAGSPPEAGARWRVNMARVVVARDAEAKSRYVTWSPINEPSLHVPARWGWVQFQAAPANRPDRASPRPAPKSR